MKSKDWKILRVSKEAKAGASVFVIAAESRLCAVTVSTPTMLFDETLHVHVSSGVTCEELITL